MSQSQDFPDCFHRVTIKGLCVRDGKLLLIHEPPTMSNTWELPGGGLDFGENIAVAFKREIEEEMCLKVIKMSEKPIYLWTHKYLNERNMEWYYSLVLAYRIELEHLDFTVTGECDDVKFFSKEELKDIKLNQQAKELIKIFNKEDFKEDF